MAQKSVIIIGAGVAGLSAGCYARANDYDATIFEHHSLPGGLCTSWKRGEFTIDGCVHWLMGSRPGSELYQIWDELGVIRNRQFVYPEEYFRLEDKDGRVLVFHNNLDKLQRHLKELSPRDSELIDSLVDGARACCKFDLQALKAPEVQTAFDKLKGNLKLLPIMRTFGRWKDASIGDVADRFQDPLLREAIRFVFLPQFPAMFMLFTMAGMHSRSSGYPVGGSLAMARSIEKRFLGLGGTVHYNATVKEILVERDRAVGVRLSNGSEHRADYVISAADGHSTIFEMLGGKYVGPEVRRCFDSFQPFPSLILVGLGVNRSFAQEPYSVAGRIWRLREPIMVGDRRGDWLSMHIYNQDPTFAPAGKTVVTSGLLADYGYWSALRERKDDYEARKQELAREVIRRMDEKYPGLAGQVEAIDVATPATFHRYTLNWRGSFEGWMATPANWLQHLSKTLPGLGGFYMAGQWVEVGGGLPPAAFSGRHVIQILCKNDRKRFTGPRS